MATDTHGVYGINYLVLNNMNKPTLDFIKDIVEKEEALYRDGFTESVLQNPWSRNLFSVLNNQEDVMQYFISKVK